MAEITWNDEVSTCYGVAGLSKDEFLEKAKRAHLYITGEKMPDTFKIGRNKYKTWIIKLEVQ